MASTSPRRSIRRGEIYWIAMDPTVGAEIQKTRSCLVISNDDSNEYSQLVTIVPITSKIKKIYPFEVLVTKGEGGLRADGLIKANQVRALDKKRIVGGPLGPVLNEIVMGRVAKALKIHLDIN